MSKPFCAFALLLSWVSIKAFSKEVLFGVLTRRKEATTCSVLSRAQHLLTATSLWKRAYPVPRGTWRACGQGVRRCLRLRMDQTVLARALQFMARSLTLKGQIAFKSVFRFPHCKDAESWRISIKSASPPPRHWCCILGLVHLYPWAIRFVGGNVRLADGIY